MWHNIDTRHYIAPPPKVAKRKRRKKKKSPEKVPAPKEQNVQGDSSVGSMGRPKSVLKAPGMLGSRLKKTVTIMEGDNISVRASVTSKISR